MDLEEIESEYSFETTEANTFFLNGLKNKVNKVSLEKKFKRRLDKAREKYYDRIRKYLSDHKYKKIQKKEKVEKKEKNKIYDYRKNFKDKLIYNLKILKFKIKIGARQMRDNEEIGAINFKFKQFKVKIKHIYIGMRNSFKYHYSEISEKIVKIFIKVQEKTKRYYEKTKEKLLGKIEKLKEFLKRIRFKKKQEEKPASEQVSTN